MELNKMKALLDSYFEGTTTLADEEALGAYFNGGIIDDSLQQFTPLFRGMRAAANEVSTAMIVLPNERRTNQWWLRIAAMVTITVGVAGFMYSNNSLSQEEQEALAALNKSKKAMMMLSQNLNKGTGTLSLAHQFETSKSNILK